MSTFELLPAAGHTDTISTTYRWRDELHTANEIRAVLHTCTDRLPELKDAITQWHPYEVAYIAHQPLNTTEAYGQWIRDSTTTSSCSDADPR